jgi:hypothetical protein
LAHAPDARHEEVSADYADMIYAETAQQVEARRKGFLRKWRLRSLRRYSSTCGARTLTGSARRWRPAWKKRATGCSPFSACPPEPA